MEEIYFKSSASGNEPLMAPVTFLKLPFRFQIYTEGGYCLQSSLLKSYQRYLSALCVVNITYELSWLSKSVHPD